MRLTKEEYETLINDHPLFSIDINKERDICVYESVTGEFIELVTQYYASYVFNGGRIVNYLYTAENNMFDEQTQTKLDTVVETVLQVLKSYKKSSGVFLHYLNAALKHEIPKKLASERESEYRGGIKLGSKQSKMISRVIALAESERLDINDDTAHQKIAKLSEIPVSEVKEIIKINQEAVRVSDRVVAEDGEESSLFDSVVSKDSNVEELFISKDSTNAIYAVIDAVFNRQQERVKPILKELLTLFFIKELGDLKAVEDLEIYSFYSDGAVKAYLENNLSQRTISQKFGVKEASASRTVNDFFDKVKERIKGQK